MPLIGRFSELAGNFTGHKRRHKSGTLQGLLKDVSYLQQFLLPWEDITGYHLHQSIISTGSAEIKKRKLRIYLLSDDSEPMEEKLITPHHMLHRSSEDLREGQQVHLRQIHKATPGQVVQLN